jgi:hypothetical protein
MVEVQASMSDAVRKPTHTFTRSTLPGFSAPLVSNLRQIVSAKYVE